MGKGIGHRFITRFSYRASVRIFGIAIVAAAMLLCSSYQGTALANADLLVLGDSISEGVQSMDASWRTQPHSYAKLLANQMAVALPLPLIKSGPLGVVESTRGRSRLRPTVEGMNLGVSGADVTSLLNERATADTQDDIKTETDLVLFPRKGSQIEVAESIGANLAVCWIGNNDVLGAATAFDHYDASQLTPVAEFRLRFIQIASRLRLLADQAVFINLPNVTDIGFLMSPQDLVHFLGSDYGLPDGSYTSMIAMFMIKLGLDDGSILNDPNYVLDSTEIATIQDRVVTFNQFIAQTAAAVGASVLDFNQVFHDAIENPYVFFGIPLERRLLGGMFSLDGVHPSNIGHAIVVNALIGLLNDSLAMSIPVLSEAELDEIFLKDPFVDKDGDGVVTGRPLAGLLETIGPLLGISGDRDDEIPSAVQPEPTNIRAQQVLRAILAAKGQNPDRAVSLTKSEILSLFGEVFTPTF